MVTLGALSLCTHTGSKGIEAMVQVKCIALLLTAVPQFIKCLLQTLLMLFLLHRVSLLKTNAPKCWQVRRKKPKDTWMCCSNDRYSSYLHLFTSGHNSLRRRSQPRWSQLATRCNTHVQVKPVIFKLQLQFLHNFSHIPCEKWWEVKLLERQWLSWINVAALATISKKKKV